MPNRRHGPRTCRANGHVRARYPPPREAAGSRGLTGIAGSIRIQIGDAISPRSLEPHEFRGARLGDHVKTRGIGQWLDRPL
jgi:hypothetical protein